MEFNARYTLAGLFTLATIAAMFVFAWWITNATGFGETKRVNIRFPVPVSGLADGSDVLFNGLKVGEVAALYFDPAEPGHVIASIDVATVAPLRQDTHVGISFSGLTGAASILLTGGTVDAPALDEGWLEADPAASRSWTDSAARVLGRLDELLLNNSGRFDAILAGLERLAGGSSESEAATYDLSAPTDFSGIDPANAGFEGILALSEPTVTLARNTDKILKAEADGALTQIGELRWTDNLPNLIQAKLIQAFENAGTGDQVLRPADAFDADFRLGLDVRSFQFDTTTGEAQIDLVAKLLDRDGAVMADRRFTGSVAAMDDTDPASLAALQDVFRQTSRQLVAWTLDSLKES